MIARRIVLGVLWVLSIVSISIYGGPLSYGFFFSITLIPVISFIYTLIVYIRFRMYQELGSVNIICRNGTPYYLTLQNEDKFAFSCVGVRLYTDLSNVSDLDEYSEYELLPGDKVRIEKKIICKYCGEYNVGVKEVIITDLFRIFRFHYRNPGEQKAFVVPRKIELSSLKSADEIIRISKRENRKEQSELDFNLRDFVPGDRIKDIHWNATAKEGILKVRTRIGEEKEAIYFYLDNTELKGSQAQVIPVNSQMKEAAIAITLYLVRNHIPVLANVSEKSFELHAPEFFDVFYQAVAGQRFDNNIDSKTRILEHANAAFNRKIQSFWCVTSTMNEELYNELRKYSEQGMKVLVYLVNDDLNCQFQTDSDRFKVILISTETELEEVL